ncbi:MAG: hypothetical protein JWP25_6282 [Bradyrhizobium sp.]|nr:hypothetical protein [Bradyrhizobium sp.]
MKSPVRSYSLRELFGAALLPERNYGGRFWSENSSLEHEMTEHIAQSPNPDRSLPLSRIGPQNKKRAHVRHMRGFN